MTAISNREEMFPGDPTMEQRRDGTIKALAGGFLSQYPWGAWSSHQQAVAWCLDTDNKKNILQSQEKTSHTHPLYLIIWAILCVCFDTI